MSVLQTLLFAIVQGITELFPVSSVAHGVLTPFLFGWDLGPEFLREHFLPFVVLLHLGTAIALLLFFRRDWFDFARGLFDSRARVQRRTLLLIVIATIPAAVLGLALERLLRGMFSNVTSAAIFLILNGLLLFFGERARGRGTRDIAEITVPQALLVGLLQSLALIPGFSRSGASMVAGFWVGLSHEAALRFSMLLATPIIVGASILELPRLARAGQAITGPALVGGVASGIVAYAAVSILTRWFRHHEFNAMRPFAIYCWILGAVVLAVTLAR